MTEHESCEGDQAKHDLGVSVPISDKQTLSPIGFHQHFSEGSNKMELWRGAENVLIGKVQGQLSEAMARQMGDYFQTFFAAGLRIHGFNDWEEMTGYESGARNYLTTWLLKIHKQLDALHFISSSRLVTMGVTVADLALGGIFTVHSERASFDDALKQLGAR